ncbi:MAG: hypothetical protein K9N46_05425 [Candidatus Marinimicrobia bacterium]|nr:hypothetical protein [Candidatus Neomarinimicrobiota bacterium]MCF7880163.1 hypothetical protein [Candidatus Neomarinimicrobiota bacterium]
MELVCTKCKQSNDFRLPLWVKTTFTFNPDGTISLLHVQPLESLEEKLTEQATGMPQGITCERCGSPAEIVLNPFEETSRARMLRQAVEDL